MSQPEDLTAREREVLDLLADGASNRQIARSLGLSLKTVQNHVSRILDKLQAADRTQAALRARGIPPAALTQPDRADLANGAVTGNAGPCDRP